MTEKRHVNIEREIKFVIDPQQAESIKDRIESGTFGIASSGSTINITDTYFRTNDPMQRIRVREQRSLKEVYSHIEVKQIQQIDGNDKISKETSVFVRDSSSAIETMIAIGHEVRNVVRKLRLTYFTDTLQVSLDYIQGVPEVHVEFEVISDQSVGMIDDTFQFVREVMSEYQN